MNFPFNFFRPKPTHTEVRYVTATKSESRAAQALAIGKRMELEIMSIHLTPEQREAAKNRALSMVFPPTQRLMRMQGRGE